MGAQSLLTNIDEASSFGDISIGNITGRDIYYCAVNITHNSSLGSLANTSKNIE